MQMEVEIDTNSGFCFGVRRAIATLEEQLSQGEELYCVGDIVHNEREIDRLRSQGLNVIDTPGLQTLTGGTVFFRAHGEPPSSYETVRSRDLKLTDATCPVVLRLQERIRDAYSRMKQAGGQVVIFGKKGHAEVIGLMGQTGGEGILIEDESQVCAVDPDKPAEIFAQTTKNPQKYAEIVSKIKSLSHSDVTAHDTICRQMAARADHLPEFAKAHDMIIFVGGAKSSNSKVLYDICRQINPRSHFVTHEDEVDSTWFDDTTRHVGVTGATSTPLWLMERVKQQIEALASSH